MQWPSQISVVSRHMGHVYFAPMFEQNVEKYVPHFGHRGISSGACERCLKDCWQSPGDTTSENGDASCSRRCSNLGPIAKELSIIKNDFPTVEETHRHSVRQCCGIAVCSLIDRQFQNHNSLWYSP